MSEKETYTLFINSTDKISGTNNNGQYNINWDDFLPRGYNFFKMIFNFQTGGGYYKDFTTTTTTQATAAALTVTTSTVTNASTTVILSASNPNILIGQSITNANISGSCFVAGIVGNVLTLSSKQTIPSGQTLTFIFTNSTSVLLSATNANIAINQSVSNGSINQPCFVSAINGTLLTLSTPQTITAGQILTFQSINVFAAARVVFNTGGKSHSFDTKTMSQSNTIGYIQRDIQTTASSSNTLGCFFNFNAPKTISRPNQNVATISIYNTCFTTASNSLLVDTNSAGNALLSDMNNWNMIIQFIPIEDSAQPNHVNF